LIKLLVLLKKDILFKKICDNKIKRFLQQIA